MMRLYDEEMREVLAIVKPGSYTTEEPTGEQKDGWRSDILAARGIRNQAVQNRLKWLEGQLLPLWEQEQREAVGVR